MLQRCPSKIVTSLLGGICNATSRIVGDTRVAVAACDNSAPQTTSAVDEAFRGSLSPLLTLTQRQSTAMAYGPTSYSHVLSWHTLVNLAGATVLHVAAANGNTVLVGQLIKHGTKELLNQRTSTGFTAVALAAEAGHSACVKLLLAAKCDITCVTSAGQTLLQLAVKSGDADVFKLVAGKDADNVQIRVRLATLLQRNFVLRMLEGHARNVNCMSYTHVHLATGCWVCLRCAFFAIDCRLHFLPLTAGSRQQRAQHCAQCGQLHTARRWPPAQHARATQRPLERANQGWRSSAAFRCLHRQREHAQILERERRHRVR